MSQKNIFRKLYGINIPLFPIGLGTASFAGVNMVNAKEYKTPSKTIIKKLFFSLFDNCSLKKNVKLLIDTSNQYGKSELKISQFLTSNTNIRERLLISTKWGLKFSKSNFAIQDYSLSNLKKSLSKSIKFLKKIDLYYIHTNPSVNPEQLSQILDNKNDVIVYLKKLKNKNYGGIKYLGISISSKENLLLLIKNKKLFDGFDVIQINANIVINNLSLMKKLYSLKIAVILNSVYRKGNQREINSKNGLKKIYKKILTDNKNVVILTGTKDINHLKQNISYVIDR